MANSIFVLAGTPTLSLPGGQIQFPATQIASSDPNTLDDYVEFDWTPTLGGSGGQSGQAYSVQAGHGIKIGSLVIAYGRIQMSTLGTITTSAQIQSLPYVIRNFDGNSFISAFFGAFTGLTATIVNISAIGTPGQSVVTLQKLAAAAANVTAMVQGDFSNTSLLDFCIIYRSTN